MRTALIVVILVVPWPFCAASVYFGIYFFAFPLRAPQQWLRLMAYLKLNNKSQMRSAQDRAKKKNNSQENK